MTPIPTGRLVTTADGRDLILVRTFTADVDDVWASITEPDRTARWFGPWTGEAGPGKVIRVRMGFEDGAPESDMTIVACAPPRHLAVSTVDEYGSWNLEATIERVDDVTRLTFVHHLDSDADASNVGPGWEYYLDMLTASHDGRATPKFDDYFPSQQSYYQAQADGRGAR